MRIAVLGAGAVGGFYGACLARAGHEVSFVARGRNLAAIRSSGMRVRSDLGDFAVYPAAESDPARVGVVELAIVAVKTYSNAEALPLLRPLVGPGTMVLTLQNGLDSAGEVAAVVGEGHVLAGTTYIGVSLEAPGEVLHVGTARRIAFGEAFGPPRITERVARLEEVLRGADVHAEAVADSRTALWEKLVFLAPIAALTAAARLPIGRLRTSPEFREAALRAMREVEAVARAEGAALSADICQQKLAYTDATSPAMRTSLMMDLVAGRPTEVEALLGGVVRRARQHAIATPAMQTLYVVLAHSARGHAPVGAS
jgi:2-dehydropantoate 2-reductase